jgi:hypothetical protein
MPYKKNSPPINKDMLLIPTNVDIAVKNKNKDVLRYSRMVKSANSFNASEPRVIKSAFEDIRK